MTLLEARQRPAYADAKVIGIPRALLYYRYGVLWQTFFERLGRTVVISDPSDRAMLDAGDALSVDECCLASKLYMGHVATLSDCCDALFIPSVDNLGRHAQFCTKFQALPDLVAAAFAIAQRPLPPILSAEIDVVETKISEQEAFSQIAFQLGASKRERSSAYACAVQAQERHDKEEAKAQERLLSFSRMTSEGERALKILVCAHPYVIHDAYIGAPVVEMMSKAGADVIFADLWDKKEAAQRSFEFSATMPWAVNREIIGALLSTHDKVDGVVMVSAFPCGPDSMTTDAVMRCIKGKPMLSLTVDAQSGTAGLETRVESFVDILRYRMRGGYVGR